MHVAIQALDRATGRVLASIPDLDVPDRATQSPYSLAKRVKARFTREGLLSTAEAACALFVSRPARRDGR